VRLVWIALVTLLTGCYDWAYLSKHFGDGDGGVTAGDASGDAGAGAPGTWFGKASALVVGGPLDLVTGDFDRDGSTDMLACVSYGGAHFYRGNGDGTFQADVKVPIDTGGCGEPVVGDFNEDGISDVALAYGGLSSSVLLLRGVGNGTFTSGGTLNVSQAHSIAIGDVDVDGHLDLAIPGTYPPPNTAGVFRGNGSGSFASVQPLALTGSLTIGKFSGKPDLVGSSTDTVLFARGNGDGTFAPPVSLPRGSGAAWLTAIDLDADGKLDLVVANATSADVSVLYGNGDGTFAPQARIAVGMSPSGIAIADFDRDGRLDLAVSDSSASAVGLLAGAGGRMFQPAASLLVGFSTGVVLAADLNHDDKPDLVAGEASKLGVNGTQVAVLLNVTPLICARVHGFTASITVTSSRSAVARSGRPSPSRSWATTTAGGERSGRPMGAAKV
jgi:hypothetical protein